MFGTNVYVCHLTDGTRESCAKQVVAFGLLEEPLAEQLANAILRRLDYAT
jgi:hypothetical protein